jgi:hypothetical protein
MRLFFLIIFQYIPQVNLTTAAKNVESVLIEACINLHKRERKLMEQTLTFACTFCGMTFKLKHQQERHELTCAKNPQKKAPKFPANTFLNHLARTL